MDNFEDIIAPIKARFGIESKDLQDFVITQPNRKHLSFYHSSLEAVKARTESVGISFAKHKQKWPKLTTGATRVLGGFARKNIVHLNKDETNRYMQRETFELANESQLIDCESAGYVIVKYENNPIGVGMLKYGENSAYLCSLYPKNWKKT